MNRTQMREQAFILLFEKEFFKEKDNAELIDVYSENIDAVSEYAVGVLSGVENNLAEIDECISKYAKGWKITRIPKVNLSILRLAIYEMKYIEDIPSSVSINEAVELAKKYSGKTDSSFVNGILGSIAREE